MFNIYFDAIQTSVPRSDIKKDILIMSVMSVVIVQTIFKDYKKRVEKGSFCSIPINIFHISGFYFDLAVAGVLAGNQLKTNGALEEHKRHE